ncbi:hypothetical protein GQ457_16G021290 [Hibiscus cannabinus]
MQIASLGKERKQGGSSKTFVQPLILRICMVHVDLWFIPDFCNSGVEYRYPIRGIGTQIQHWNLGIVSVPREGYRYPSSPLGLEYRYWLPSIDTSCLKTTFEFDYGIPRVTISGRPCDWIGSRGLQFVSDPTVDIFLESDGSDDDTWQRGGLGFLTRGTGDEWSMLLVGCNMGRWIRSDPTVKMVTRGSRR